MNASFKKREPPFPCLYSRASWPPPAYFILIHLHHDGSAKYLLYGRPADSLSDTFFVFPSVCSGLMFIIISTLRSLYTWIFLGDSNKPNPNIYSRTVCPDGLLIWFQIERRLETFDSFPESLLLGWWSVCVEEGVREGKGSNHERRAASSALFTAGSRRHLRVGRSITKP